MPFLEVNVEEEQKELEELLQDPEAQKAYELFNKEYELKKMLSAARKERQLTQQSLSEKTGLSQQAISRIENTNDNHGFTFRTLFRYLDGIGYELSIKKL
jgi:DNA-binding XRE family transcriptional regulator